MDADQHGDKIRASVDGGFLMANINDWISLGKKFIVGILGFCGVMIAFATIGLVIPLIAAVTGSTMGSVMAYLMGGTVLMMFVMMALFIGFVVKEELDGGFW